MVAGDSVSTTRCHCACESIRCCCVLTVGSFAVFSKTVRGEFYMISYSSWEDEFNEILEKVSDIGIHVK